MKSPTSYKPPANKLGRLAGKILVFAIWLAIFELLHLMIHGEVFRLNLSELMFGVWVALFTVFMVDITQREQIADRRPAVIRRIK